jgi:RND family efflux transporter MFP subunit
VEVTPVDIADVTDIVSGVGNVAAMRDVKVASETAGRVLRVHVKVGDAVKQGQTLVEVDAELKEAAAEQARAQMLAAKTNLEKSKKDFERTQMLYNTGDVADIELEGYRLTYQSAEAHKGATAVLRAADRQVSDSRIKAPVPGRVPRGAWRSEKWSALEWRLPISSTYRR